MCSGVQQSVKKGILSSVQVYNKQSTNAFFQVFRCTTNSQQRHFSSVQVYNKQSTKAFCQVFRCTTNSLLKEGQYHSMPVCCHHQDTSPYNNTCAVLTKHHTIPLNIQLDLLTTWHFFQLFIVRVNPSLLVQSDQHVAVCHQLGNPLNNTTLLIQWDNMLKLNPKFL